MSLSAKESAAAAKRFAPSPAVARAVRTLLQLLASGGLTAAVYAIVGRLSPAHTVEVMGGFGVAVTFAQNYLEDKGLLPAILKTATEVAAPAPAKK